MEGGEAAASHPLLLELRGKQRQLLPHHQPLKTSLFARGILPTLHLPLHPLTISLQVGGTRGRVWPQQESRGSRQWPTKVSHTEYVQDYMYSHCVLKAEFQTHNICINHLHGVFYGFRDKYMYNIYTIV